MPACCEMEIAEVCVPIPLKIIAEFRYRYQIPLGTNTLPYKPIQTPGGRLKWPSAITRLTAHFISDLTSDLIFFDHAP